MNSKILFALVATTLFSIAFAIPEPEEMLQNYAGKDGVNDLTKDELIATHGFFSFIGRMVKKYAPKVIKSGGEALAKKVIPKLVDKATKALDEKLNPGVQTHSLFSDIKARFAKCNKDPKCAIKKIARQLVEAGRPIIEEILPEIKEEMKKILEKIENKSQA